MGVTIENFGADDAAEIDEAYRIGRAAEAADVPDFPPLCRENFVDRLRRPMPGRVPLSALARLDGAPAGYLRLELRELDNPTLATLDLAVHPECRRRGVGRALHGHALRLLRGSGRSRMIAPVVSTLPGGAPRSAAGSAFAAAVGAVPALPEVRRRLDLTRLDHAGLDAARAEAGARAAGYDLVAWRDLTPDGYLADIAHLDGRLLLDAPLGDLAWEPEKVDSDRIRQTDRILVGRGRRRYQQAARHRASGRLVAWTVLEFGPEHPWHAFQQITIVDPAHRGHRLGLLTKIENLRYVLRHEPEVRVVDTFNAAVNSHMIAVNERLGFRPVDAWTEWQQTI